MQEYARLENKKTTPHATPHNAPPRLRCRRAPLEHPASIATNTNRGEPPGSGRGVAARRAAPLPESHARACSRGRASASRGCAEHQGKHGLGAVRGYNLLETDWPCQTWVVGGALLLGAAIFAAMPLKKPMLALQLSDEDMSDSESEEEVLDNANSSPGSDSSGGLRRSLGGLSLSMPGDDDGGGYSEESPPGEKRTRGPRPLKRQDSYEVTPTMTIELGGLRIKPEGLVESPRGRGNKMRTAFNLREELEHVKLLGKGATSKVFLARHRDSGALFAVKELNAMADEDTRHMAVNELKIANKHAALEAPNLVRFVDAYFHNDKICIAMEFADGVRRFRPPPAAFASARFRRTPTQKEPAVHWCPLSGLF